MCLPIIKELVSNLTFLDAVFQEVAWPLLIAARTKVQLEKCSLKSMLYWEPIFMSFVISNISVEIMNLSLDKWQLVKTGKFALSESIRGNKLSRFRRVTTGQIQRFGSNPSAAGLWVDILALKLSFRKFSLRDCIVPILESYFKRLNDKIHVKFLYPWLQG